MATHTQPRMLTDVRFVQLSLDEASSNGKIRVKGEFAKCDAATENKRIYPEGVWTKEIGRLGKAMTERRVYGEMDHPADGRTSLQRVSHIITGLKVSKDGKVVGEAEVLPTEAGKNLQALLASGCKVGVSSRGYGSTKSNDKGEEVVQGDYKLVTFDFVAEPADNDAFPDVQAESKNVIFEGVDMNAEQEKEKAAEWAKKLQAEKNGESSPSDIRDEFARDILGGLSKLKGEALEEARQKLAEDPKLGGALALIENLKKLIGPFLSEDDKKSVFEAENTALKAENAKLKTEKSDLDLKLKTTIDERDRAVSAAKQAGYKYWLEHVLANDADADLVRKMVGDVKDYENLAALQAKVEGFRKELAKKRDETKKADETRKAEIADATAKLDEARKAAETKVAKLEEAFEKSLKSEKQLALKLYAEQRLTNHPHAAKIRPVLESAKFESKDQINELFEDFRERASDPDELESIRARVRANVGGGEEDRDEENLTEDRREKKAKSSEKDYNGLGTDLGSLRKLSGIRSR